MMNKLILALAITCAFVIAPFAIAAYDSAPQLAPCACCGDVCECETCLCDANGCACDSGGECACTPLCCTSCCRD